MNNHANMARLWWLAMILICVGRPVQSFAPATLPVPSSASASRRQHPSSNCRQPFHSTRRQQQSSLWQSTPQRNNDENSNDDDEDTAVAEFLKEYNDNNSNDDATLNLYNAAPLFTGSLVLVTTTFLCGYMIYAGLTGDDPLAGHPLPR